VIGGLGGVTELSSLVIFRHTNKTTRASAVCDPMLQILAAAVSPLLAPLTPCQRQTQIIPMNTKFVTHNPQRACSRSPKNQATKTNPVKKAISLVGIVCIATENPLSIEK